MLGEFLLTAALIAGQPPAQPAPMPNVPALPAAPTTPALPGTTVLAPGTIIEEAPAEPEKPKYLLESVLQDTWLGQNGIKMYGWAQGSYNTSTASASNAPVPFIDRANEFLFNQLWIGAVKEVDTANKQLQLGGKIDFLYGTDARFTIARGLFDDQVRRGEPRPVDIYQFYADAFLPGVGPQGSTVRVGRFATHCSYEVVQAVDNPFLTRSYLFQANPFTHTGVYVITPLSDDLTISNGFAVGSDNFVGDPTNQLNYLGQIKWAPKNGSSQVIFNTVLTDPQFNVAEGFAQYNVFNLQVIQKVTDDITYVADATYSYTKGVPGIGNADWYGIANYFLYKVTDNVSSQLRFELFDDSEGFRTGFRGLYTELTYGISWNPTPWLQLRPAVRYDHNNNAPFEGSKGLMTGTFDAILRY